MAWQQAGGVWMDASGPLPRLPSRGSRHCCSSETAAPKTRRVRCCCWWCGLASAGRRRAAGTHPCSVAWHLELELERAVWSAPKVCFPAPRRAARGGPCVRACLLLCIPSSCATQRKGPGPAPGHAPNLQVFHFTGAPRAVVRPLHLQVNESGTGLRSFCTHKKRFFCA